MSDFRRALTDGLLRGAWRNLVRGGLTLRSSADGPPPPAGSRAAPARKGAEASGGGLGREAEDLGALRVDGDADPLLGPQVVRGAPGGQPAGPGLHPGEVGDLGPVRVRRPVGVDLAALVDLVDVRVAVDQDDRFAEGDRPR